MSAAAKESTTEAAGGAGGGSKVGRLVFPVFILLNLAGLGAGVFLTYSATLGHKPKAIREAEVREALDQARIKDVAPKGSALLYTMPAFTVNLFGTPRRLIQVEMTFDMLDQDGFEEIVRNSAAARDAIVQILNEKTFQDIESVQGKLFLKDQIAVTLNKQFSAAVIKDIYFSEFLVQAL
jgi:flagellar FliL protein